MSNNNSLEILNGVQQIIINQANSSGINLANEFASIQDFKNFVIAFAFKGLMDAGMEVKAAFDTTLGDGSYDKLAADTYAKFNA